MSHPPPVPGNPPPWPQQPAMARPVPAVPLNLPQPQRFDRRPGTITAIGVISAIMALGTLLGCLFVGGWALAMYATSKMPPALLVPPTAPVTAQPTVQQGPQEDEINGLPESQRIAVITALSRAKSLSRDRIRQVDALLAHSGHVMFPTVNESSTVQSIRPAITDSGVLPSASKPGKGPHYFIIGTGRIEVYDDHAVFRPTGSGETTSVSADEAEPEAPAAPPPPLTVRQSLGARAVKKLATPSLLVMLEALVSGALAIFLLVAAIMVLRNSLAGARLHWIYIAIKLPLTIAAAALGWWLWTQYVSAMNVTGGTTGFAASAAVLGLIGTMLSALWPIVLIVLLKSKPVREYYQLEREEALARRF